MRWVKAEFVADLPFEPHPDYPDPIGGRNVSEALLGILEGIGARTVSFEFAGDHGWDWEIYCGRHRMWAQLTHFFPECILLIQDLAPEGPFWKRRPSAVYKDLLRRFAAALAADGRFHDIEWVWQDSSGRDAGPVLELMSATAPADG